MLIEVLEFIKLLFFVWTKLDENWAVDVMRNVIPDMRRVTPMVVNTPA